MRKVKWILIHNEWKINEAIEKLCVSSDKILYQPNVVNTEMFDIAISKEEARKNLIYQKIKRLLYIQGICMAGKELVCWLTHLNI